VVVVVVVVVVAVVVVVVTVASSWRSTCQAPLMSRRWYLRLWIPMAEAT